jgi:hypothetical protein
MAGKRALDPAIKALVEERLHPNECVLDWSARGRNEVMVRLIDSELHQSLQGSRIRRIRNGGYGRGLVFQRREGQWVFTDFADWMS